MSDNGIGGEKTEQAEYSTKEIADTVGIHVNTVRFYEEIGFITKPERRRNGYRIYTALQLDQCRLIRAAMRSEVLQNGLRKKAVEIIKLCAALRFDAAVAETDEYIRMIETERGGARAAIAAVENLLQRKPAAGGVSLSRRDAAKALQVTSETLRTWERSGLLEVGRLKNGYRVYGTDDMERLNIIRTLRCAGYSLSAILRLLHGLDRHEADSVETLLNTPDDEEDIISVCDRLIVSLRGTGSDAYLLRRMIVEMKEKYTIQ